MLPYVHNKLLNIMSMLCIKNRGREDSQTQTAQLNGKAIDFDTTSLFIFTKPEHDDIFSKTEG